MKIRLSIILLLLVNSFYAQTEKAPVYLGCENETLENIESCFFNKLTETVETNFKTPESVKNENYKGSIRVVFLVKTDGNFEVIYVNSVFKELETEARRVFKTLPKITAATYNGRAIERRYVMPIAIPIGSQVEDIDQLETVVIKHNTIQKVSQKNNINVQFPEHQSQVNIPFTHVKYDALQYELNQIDNTHSSVKPFIYSDVSKHIDLDTPKQSLYKKADTWFGKKLWNDHFVTIQSDDFSTDSKMSYWFTIDPVFDLQVGKDNSNQDYTYNNTRAIKINGGLGKKFSFSASVYESQGRFADYINDFNTSNNIVIGRGNFKDFKTDGFDYPVAEGYISYTPNTFFSFQAGHGKNFIGDGYRSLFLSDVSSPYPYFKISTQFWKIKYTNLWMAIDDVRPEVSIDGVNLRKYVAMHHLSYNVTKKLNIGLFEAVVTNNESNNGFDVNYFNPIIFYRTVEFNKGSSGGNALVGLNASYKWNKSLFLYSQFLLDELTIDLLKDGNGYWGNKFGFQAGFKYYNAFGVKNLYVQGETNIARPFTYSHLKPSLNYAHFNQPLAHLWGSNFYELIGIARYSKNRWFGNAKLVYGKKGFDFEGQTESYGGNIYISYLDRISNFGNDIAQGNKTDIFIGDFQAGYIVNPSTNLKLFVGMTYRNFTPGTETTNFNKQNTTWFSFGLKTDLFNWYFDF
jgi:hypothetical protein